MLKFLITHPYIEVLFWFCWVPSLLIWSRYYKILARYPKTFIKCIVVVLALAIPWDWFAVGAKIWYFPAGCCIAGHLYNIPWEEIMFMITFTIYIVSLALLFRHKFIKKWKF